MVIKSAVTAYLVILEQDVSLAMLVFMVVLKHQVYIYFQSLNYLFKITTGGEVQGGILVLTHQAIFMQKMYLLNASYI